MTFMVSFVLVALAAAQAPAAPPRSVLLSGCVSRPAPARPFTLVDGSGARYRLSGRTVRKFAGQRVEIFGGFPDRGLRIRGGLLPSPNVAGQTGAMDPTRAAQAGVSGSMTVGSDDQLPEFRVTRVLALDGSCE